MVYLVASFAIAGLIAGLRAAHLWHQGSRVDFRPYVEVNGQPKLLNPLQHPSEWVEAIRKNNEKSGELNRSAAAWTALSVILSAASSCFGAWPSVEAAWASS